MPESSVNHVLDALEHMAERVVGTNLQSAETDGLESTTN